MGHYLSEMIGFDEPPRRQAMPVKRVVIIDGSFSGTPMYVAAEEADAAEWLDAKQKQLEGEGKTCTRENSLTLRTTWGSGGYTSFRCYVVPSAV